LGIAFGNGQQTSAHEKLLEGGQRALSPGIKLLGPLQSRVPGEESDLQQTAGAGAAAGSP